MLWMKEYLSKMIYLILSCKNKKYKEIINLIQKIDKMYVIMST